MHEANFTEEIVYAIQTELEKFPEHKPKRISVRVGAMLHLNEESVRAYYEQMTKGSGLEGVELVLSEEEVEVYCWQCNRRGPVVDHHFLNCKFCNSTDVEVMKGDKIHIDSIELEN